MASPVSQMLLSGKIITIISIIFSLTSVSIYTSFLLSIFWFKTIKKVPEFSLFYCHFVYDIGYSLAMFSNLVIVLLSTTDAVQFFIENRNVAFFIIYPSFLIGSARLLLVLIIEIDRTFATYFPIIFHNYRKLIPTFSILSITIIYALFDVSVMFIFCEYRIDLPPGCTNMLCAFNTCYRSYWLTYEKVVNSLIISLSLLLSIKLFMMNYNKQYINADLKRANQLALLDTCIIVIFYMTPSNIITFFPNFYTYLGPVTSFCKNMGLIVEGYLIWKHLRKRRDNKKSIVVKSKSSTMGN